MTTTTAASSNGHAPAVTPAPANERAHFAEAEKWLGFAEDRYRNDETTTWADTCARIAAVHATLAQAADIDALRECIDPSGIRFRTETKPVTR